MQLFLYQVFTQFKCKLEKAVHWERNRTNGQHFTKESIELCNCFSTPLAHVNCASGSLVDIAIRKAKQSMNIKVNEGKKSI